jgi:alkanesulfonate monooxygenase SsuD/methylene tetrahydromethanopterin reductase-like flavin-dependent oxidoreductase (luciferase family)
MESSLDPMAWASALLAVTKRMTIFGTVHTAMHHPVAVAKACATADHIGTGRFALNIVCGWNRPEYDMFGLQFLPDHVDKYEHGQEWWDIVERLWMTGEPFDYRGKYFQLTNVSGWPKPFGGTRPIVVNAAVSDQGRDFAARNCDFWFTVFPEIENAPAMIEDIRRRGRKYGRDVRVIAVTSVVCRPTMREALEFDEYYSNEHADWECVDYNLELLGLYGGAPPARPAEEISPTAGPGVRMLSDHRRSRLRGRAVSANLRSRRRRLHGRVRELFGRSWSLRR